MLILYGRSKKQSEDAMIVFGEDYISIQDAEGIEIVHWHQDEWREDSKMVFLIANAIKVFYEDGEQKVIDVISKDFIPPPIYIERL